VAHRLVVGVDGVLDRGPEVVDCVGAKSSRDGDDHLVPEHGEANDGAGSMFGHEVPPGTARLVHQVLSPELAQVVSGLADGVGVLALAGHRLALGGEVRDGEAAGGHRQCQSCAQGVALLALLRSMPPTRVVPMVEGEGNS
jgi:hypothetical protein